MRASVISLGEIVIFLGLDVNNLKEYDSSEFKTGKKGVIGSGTFSEVVQCYHVTLGTVVLKCYGLTGDTNGIKRQLDE